ncbi:bacitracin ABC transporter ATP-binding protein [Gordoniibacillus kamchatkensis]|uniref:Bacitracin ABC transporter ATP-binding protein n=1 Tax=Gordoniibacillus kamchatkensis TaxID=1590651 RepID=A0ABR5AB52_9BACL|nr:ABC transporter ATP-binding protein [Paenibacillus sp. VKM B-2647]KIL38122.1 bacitracin ABC transporter ATP-binding protein [Paenibacillus sp. VKM B-2647]
MTAPILKLSNLTKKIGNKLIIDRLNFEVPRGEIFGFLGPNGAGKTTTIRMMVGLMSITEGDILIDGESITHNYNKAIVKVGAIVENPEMYKYLSGYRNLVHFARMVPGVTQERIHEVIRLVGLENRIQDKVKTYSLGMRQRLGVAQALLHKPSVLILDEPTNGLDPAGIRELRDYLYKLTREEGIAVIVSSHLLAEMELMCDRVAVIQHGRLVTVQTIKEFMSEGTQGSVVFEVDNSEKALKILSEELSAHARVTENGVECWLDKEQVAEGNERLIRGGIKVYEIKRNSLTLEDKFLKITGGESVG